MSFHFCNFPMVHRHSIETIHQIFICISFMKPAFNMH
uniref:Uncharacterized protein n=1 Tax=Anguilla anguilla TaxID=7936 RepID=A0A0E9SGP3_ANGAN